MTRWNDGRRASWLVLTVGLLLAACGGLVSEEDEPLVVPPPTMPPADSCDSVPACPQGQHCDKGACVPDVAACPQAIAPRLVYTATGSETFDTWTVVTAQGRDLVQLTAQKQYPPPVAADHETFVDTVTGEVSTWSHAPGSGFFFPCAQGACACHYGSDGSESIEVGLTLHDGVWSTSQHHPLPSGQLIFGDDRFFGSGTLVTETLDHSLSKWTLSTGAVDPLLSIAGYSMWSQRETSDGWQLLGRQQGATQQEMSWSTAPLSSGASWQPLLMVKAPWFALASLVRAGDQWFAIHDAHEDGVGARYHVYRVGPGEQTETGTSLDPALFDVAATYRVDGPRFGDDHAGRVVSCSGGRCRLVSVNLDTVQVTEQAAIDLGTPGLTLAHTRWLDCNAVDVLVGTYVDDPATPGKVRPGALWYTRIVP